MTPVTAYEYISTRLQSSVTRPTDRPIRRPALANLRTRYMLRFVLYWYYTSAQNRQLILLA